MLRYPRRALLIALLVIAVFVAFGFNLESRLSPATLDIYGTGAQRSNQLLREHFGDTALFAILLQGPPAAIDRQGPALVRSLREDPKVTTLSPWDRGSVARLRPGPRRALILADFHVPTVQAVNETVPLLNETLKTDIQAPVTATQSGFATLSRSVEDESIAASEQGELIALPILLVVLLLVFRSPVAAALPLAFGAIAVFSSRGLLSIITHFFAVDALALTVCTMMGLALGVDYSLLMVSRFREELAGGADPIDAAWATRRTAGRTTVFAGSTLVLSMLVALFVVPGALLASLAGTLALVVVLTVLVAVMVGPPLLLLIGPNIDRWRVGAAPNGERSRLMTVVSAALRRPAPVAALIGFVVLVLATPAIALKTGPFSINQLSHSDPARRDAELIQKTIGAGFEAPYVIVAAAKQGTVTEPDRLDALGRWQRRIAATPGVQSVIGPGQVSDAVESIRRTGNAIFRSDEKTGPLSALSRLGRNLGRAAGGVAALRAGLSKATFGAGLLAQGSGGAEEGAIAIADGLDQATSGSQEALDALDKFAEGTRELVSAQARAANGGLAVKFGSHDLIPNLNSNVLPRVGKLKKSLDRDAGTTVPKIQAATQATDEQLQTALRELEGMTAGKSDPNYAATLDAMRQASATSSPVPGELTTLQGALADEAEGAKQIERSLEDTLAAVKTLSARSKQLSEGLYQILAGSKKLSAGASRLDREAKRLSTGLDQLGSGASELAGGLARLTGGTTELERRLGEAYSRSHRLQSGLRQITVRVTVQNAKINRRIDKIRRTTPAFFDSGYFVLSTLDGTRGHLHKRASEVVDLNGGGQAAALLVFTRYGFNSSGSIALNGRLQRDAEALGREADLTTGVAGGTATLNTYSRVTRQRIPYVIVAITIATFLVLVLVLRALPLAAIAVGLNLATVAVAFGVLTLLSNVPDGWPLGGREYVDAVGATMIFGVVFGLSIDYAVFLLVRMREHYDRNGSNAAAIEFGLEKTARVITGAAAIMMAVFIAYAGASIATVSELGVGLTVAVLLDATVVRIVLLPALMLLIGERVWWLPSSLERLLPRLNV